MGRHQFGPGGHQNYKVVVGHEGQRRTYSRKYNQNYAMITNNGNELLLLSKPVLKLSHFTNRLRSFINMIASITLVRRPGKWKVLKTHTSKVVISLI